VNIQSYKLMMENPLHRSLRMSAKIFPVSSHGVFDPPGFHQAMRIDGVASIVSLSGQVAMDVGGKVIHRGDFAEQARSVLTNIKDLVEAAGSSLDKVFKLTVYVTNVGYRNEFVSIREEFFGPKTPPISMVAVTALTHPDWLIEIDALAAC
jgi:2-iminobutanoate/2-iminopropanoate deaminase